MTNLRNRMEWFILGFYSTHGKSDIPGLKPNDVHHDESRLNKMSFESMKGGTVKVASLSVQ